jgi:hypothetical protein
MLKTPYLKEEVGIVHTIILATLKGRVGGSEV